MQRREQFLQGLLELHKLRDPGTRRAAWRGSIASVARACAEGLPSPLDGLSPSAVVDSVRVALSSGLIDDLDWLSASSAGAALYEIAALLPPGNEKRELGRRVLARLVDGDADTFVALATRMALGSGKGLGGDAVRARVALSLALPGAYGVHIDALALALVSRRELAREWLVQPAAGSLPDRRLAARLIEQSARAIVRHVAQGDERPLVVLRSEAVSRVSDRLLEDREPLVWRHVAIARGLLAPYVSSYARAIEQGLAPAMTPTEWRRAATSLTAMAASRPDEIVKRLREALSRGFLRRDPGAAQALLWGLPAAAETEPEAAEEMLEIICEVAPPMVVAETLPSLMVLGFNGPRVRRCAASLRESLAGAPVSSNGALDDGAAALRVGVMAELSPPEERAQTAQDVIWEGMRAFAERGARPAFIAGLEALEIVRGHLDTLDALDPQAEGGRHGAISRRAAFSALREIDAGLLEDGLLHDLLVLGLRSSEAQLALGEVGRMYDRLAGWAVEREQAPLSRSGPLEHRTLRFHRLRMLLHLADTPDALDGDEASSGQVLRARCVRIANLMLRHLVTGPPPALHRIICASFARALDALLREEGCDPADVLLWIAQRGLSYDDIGTLVEASMNSDWCSLLRSYQRMMRALDDAEPQNGLAGDELSAETLIVPGLLGKTISMPSLAHLGAVGKRVEALAELATHMEADASNRVESLRASLMRLARALAKILTSRSLTSLAGSAGEGPSRLRELESALIAFAQSCAGARQRMGDRMNEGIPSLALSLSSAIDAACSGTAHEGVAFAVASAREELSIALPPLFVEIVGSVLDTLPSMPVATASQASSPELLEAPLPAWLPRRRTLGGFYIVRALGSGTGGTVFMACRTEERHDQRSERFALKVPEYDGSAARSLSEDQFLQLFREEASALLGLPSHTNLARFVTFDLAARPKPILVMELVDGLALERLLLSAQLDMARAGEILDGVLAGLGAMHGAGVGHLDLKPSNVILRPSNQPVLVDFGLSGRRIRPGCGTLNYGAPEIWGVLPDGSDGTEFSPAATDVYAFACLAYEMLTGHELFDAPTESALIASHILHDGWPPRLLALAEEPAARPLCDILSHALRHDPRERPPVAHLRSWLPDAFKPLLTSSWPIPLPLAVS